LIYRFCIRKKPLEKKFAIITVIICGFFLFLIMWLIAQSIADEGANATACIVWSFINYLILSKGQNGEKMVDLREKSIPKKEVSIMTGNKTAVPKQISFCRKCGKQLVKNSTFCNACGSKIEWN
jgi:hypothetical protein